ncbi:MAG TPA: substrate-binding domain-containing protein [Candidatus Saccharimonadales bacterium]|jgi:ABC-type sugar transport system substrate-binding protein|nr:substrate-binding domain-containing protein [Candidatus Saccharimonadales bacterium]
MKRFSVVVSLPGQNNYLLEQEVVVKQCAERLGVDLKVLNANSDAIAQSQQLLEVIQMSNNRPDGIIIEPVTNAGLPRVADAAVNAGIAWVISNARVDYLDTLRRDAKVPVFTVTQEHAEIGRVQGRQWSALLPRGGSVLYLRGPAVNFLASRRSEGLESVLPPNIHMKTIKIQWTGESAYNSVSSWLRLSTVRADETHLVAAQNTDFIVAARSAFRDHAVAVEREKWGNVPCTGVGVLSQVKPMLNDGTLAAAVVTSLTMDTALQMLVQALQTGAQPPDYSYVPGWSSPSLEELAERHKASVGSGR